MLFFIILIVPAITANHVISLKPLKHKPIEPYDSRTPQFRMVHVKGELDSTTLSLFKHLTGLEIERCAITDLRPDTFKSTYLEILDIHDNIEFPTITSTTFEYLRNLKVFRFTFNPYTEIEEGAFVKLRNLDVLAISHQNIKNVTKAFLEGLDKLSELSLTYNEIEFIEQDAFDHIKDLTAIYLGHNFIKSITSGTFKNQLKLEDLQLQDNQLGNEENSYYVNWGEFERIVTLRSLNIARNKLRYINVKDLIRTFPLMESINFLPNNLTCSSELYITKVLRHYRIQIEYYGNDHSNCKRLDFNSLGDVVFDNE